LHLIIFARMLKHLKNKLNHVLKSYILIISFISIYSCAKQNDPLKSVLFENPNPPNRDTDIAIRGVMVHFNEIKSGSDIEIIYTPKKAYFDSINPPVHLVDISSKNHFVIRNLLLKPDRTYYWAYTVENIAGEIQSEVQSFTTAGFDGNWALFSIPNGESDNTDSLLVENEDVLEFQISGGLAKIKPYNKIDTAFYDATFAYDEEASEITFTVKKSNSKFMFTLYNLGFHEFYNDVIMILSINMGNGNTLIYKRR
jgi:hypothetical protein